MGTRKGWDQLSPSRIKDLERYGVDQAYYESGASLAFTRRHANTPEHPWEAGKNPERYAGYLDRHPNADKPMRALVEKDYEGTPTGQQIQPIHELKWNVEERGLIGHHWNALKEHLRSRQGNFDKLFAPFRGRIIGGHDGIQEYILETRRDIIDAYLNARSNDEVYEHIYENPPA